MNDKNVAFVLLTYCNKYFFVRCAFMVLVIHIEFYFVLLCKRLLFLSYYFILFVFNFDLRLYL